jgi:2-phosphosulfolactate phosphatase
MKLHIAQGTTTAYPAADINIVIDVIRAFTVSHIAFMRGVREIFLVNTVEEAFALKTQHAGYLLAGEIGALPIVGFDLDNSPHTFSTADLDGKSLVQKTTNGVKATLLALSAPTVFVTGLSNARKTALHVKQLASSIPNCRINIIASHPQDDDDLACAEYIQDQLVGRNSIPVEAIQNRIKNARSAKKFFDPEQPEFNEKDIAFCIREVDCDFVMQVDSNARPPRIVKQVSLTLTRSAVV